MLKINAIAFYVLTALTLWGAPAATAAQTAAQPKFEKETVRIVSRDRSIHVFQVEVAKTLPQQTHGLMNRTSLAADHGMIFMMEQERQVKMWMKNTLIPLDMLFIDKTGKIIYIKTRTMPKSLQTITTPQPAKAVLELAGGTVAKQHIAVGDMLTEPAFDGKP